MQNEAAVGDADAAVTLHSTDQGPLLDLFRQVEELCPIQAVALGQAEGHDLQLAVGEGIDLRGGGELERAGDLLRGDIVGIDDEAEPHEALERFDIIHVILVPEAGDGVPGAHLARKLAGDKVCLVIAGGGDEHIGFRDLSFAQHGRGGTASAHAHHIHGARGVFQQLAVRVDERDVVPRLTEPPGDGIANLARARDHDGQSFLVLHGSLLMRRVRRLLRFSYYNTGL